MTASRYDFASLASAMRVSEHEAARQLSVAGSTEQLYRRTGMSERVADRLACRAGLHPSLVWPDWYAAPTADAEAAEQERQERRRGQWAASARKRWDRDEAHRIARADYMREYRAAARGAIAAQKRAWRDANLDSVRARNRVNQAAYRARLKARKQAA